jgi:hypothetical protein
MDKDLIGYFLPEELLEKFTITKVEELGEVSHKRMILQIDLEEKNQLPSGYDSSKYESKGFYQEKNNPGLSNTRKSGLFMYKATTVAT